jgi:hypothetical protein
LGQLQKPLIGILSQTAGSTDKFWVNPVNFRLKVEIPLSPEPWWRPVLPGGGHDIIKTFHGESYLWALTNPGAMIILGWRGGGGVASTPLKPTSTRACITIACGARGAVNRRRAVAAAAAAAAALRRMRRQRRRRHHVLVALVQQRLLPRRRHRVAHLRPPRGRRVKFYIRQRAVAQHSQVDPAWFDCKNPYKGLRVDPDSGPTPCISGSPQHAPLSRLSRSRPGSEGGRKALVCL